MKTIYITLLTALFFSANAQFTMLSIWHAPDSTSTQTTREYDSTSAIPKAMGANLTWNFSNMVMKSSTSSEHFFPASAGINATLYPTATIVGKTGTSTTYYSTAPSAFEFLGQNTDKLTDPMTMIKWPVTFGSSWTDTFAGPTSLGQATGSLTGGCTGYGTVVLPGGAIYSNCMQLRTQTHGTYGGTATVTSDVYAYYSDLQRFPLMEVEYSLLLDGTDTIFNSATVRVNELVAVGISDHNFNASYDIYPNPATDNFTVKLSNPNADNCNVTIINITGQVVKVINLGNNATVEEKVSVNGLNSGIYMIKTTLGERSSTRRLVVQ